jgi:DNA repair protein RadC
LNHEQPSTTSQDSSDRVILAELLFAKNIGHVREAWKAGFRHQIKGKAGHVHNQPAGEITPSPGRGK